MEGERVLKPYRSLNFNFLLKYSDQGRSVVCWIFHIVLKYEIWGRSSNGRLDGGSYVLIRCLDGS